MKFKIPKFIYPILFGLVAGWLVSTVTGSLLVAPKPTPVPHTVAKSEVKRLNDRDVEEIANKNIFNLKLLSGENIPSEDIQDDNSSDTKQYDKPPFKATLIGLFYDEKKNKGIAIINLDSETVAVSIGKEKSGIKLLSIAGRYANIEKNNKKYSLTLAQGEKVAGSSVVAKATPTQDSGSNINVNVSKDELKEELKDLNKILQSAAITPFYENGAFVGYRFVSIKPNSPILKLGLKVGDIITRIDGNDLTSPEPLFNMLTKIDDIHAVNIDMMRSQQKKTLFLDVK